MSLLSTLAVQAHGGEIPGTQKAEWKEDFTEVSEGKKESLPPGWAVRKKPGTKPAVFGIIKDGTANRSYLHMEADKASASVITRVDGIDLSKTPILRWRWRVTKLPEGADGRDKKKDDQAIGIYVGTGNNPAFVKTVSYRWDTLTPKGSTGESRYAGGAVRDKWFTLRNKEDDGKAGWVEETRNVAEDFFKSWGFLPRPVYVSVSCNSQYTGTEAAADLDWIEFVASEEYRVAKAPQKGFKRYLMDLLSDKYRRLRDKVKEMFRKHVKGAPENDIR